MAKIHAVTMPKWGMTMVEGKLVGWLAGEGADVKRGQDLMEVETEKITNVVESPGAGALRRILTPVGGTAPVGALLAVLAEPEVPDAEIDAFVSSYAERAGTAKEGAAAPAARLVEAGGLKLNALSLGEGGTPVVLLHGFGGDLGAWLFNQEALATDRQTLALDLPAHGESDPLGASPSLDDVVAAVAGALDALGATRAHLVGHSLGGAVALALAAKEPGRVASLALIAPAGLGPVISTDYLEAFLSADRRKPMKAALGQLFVDPEAVSAAMVENMLRFKRRDGVAPSLEALARLLGTDGRQGLDLREALARVEAPVLAIWGDKDAIVPPPQDLPPNVRVERIEGAGHMPMMEAAGAVNRLLAAHISAAEQ